MLGKDTNTMKRIITAVAVITMMAATSFSQTTKKEKADRFLDRYEALVNRMQDQYSQNTDSIERWKYERALIKQDYKKTYKAILTDEQQTRYASLSTQYKKRSMEFSLGKTGEKLDTLGVKIGRSAQRTGNKIKGWFEGLTK